MTVNIYAMVSVGNPKQFSDGSFTNDCCRTAFCHAVLIILFSYSRTSTHVNHKPIHRQDTTDLLAMVNIFRFVCGDG